jgi:hypothetical protein
LYYRTTYAIDSTNAEILVFGSSRANHHYVPDVFMKYLKGTFYNAGREGNFILYNYAVFKAVISRYTPEVIIFDLNSDELFHDKESYDRLSSLLPYYKDHAEIREIINLRGPFERVKIVSEIYPYNSKILTIIAGNLKMNHKRKDDVFGYVPLNKTISDTSLRNLSTIQGTIDKNKVNALKSIIRVCKEKGIGLFIVVSPVYARVEKNDSLKLLAQITATENIQFYDLTGDSIILANPGFFQDQDHLNNRGAEYFSEIIANRIREDCYDSK